MRNSFSLFAKALPCLRSDFANKEKDFLKLKFEKISQTRHYVKNKERISQRKKEWYARKKAERLAMDINFNEKRK